MLICETCGQKIRKLNPHRMDRHKVKMLELIARANNAGVEWVRATAGSVVYYGDSPIRAPYRAQAHCSRLEYFGLVEHDDVRRSSKYRATRPGREFLRGTWTVPEIIYCKDGKVIEQSDRRVAIGQVRGVVLDEEYWSNYWAIQVSQRELFA